MFAGLEYSEASTMSPATPEESSKGFCTFVVDPSKWEALEASSVVEGSMTEPSMSAPNIDSSPTDCDRTEALPETPKELVSGLLRFLCVRKVVRWCQVTVCEKGGVRSLCGGKMVSGYSVWERWCQVTVCEKGGVRLLCVRKVVSGYCV